MEISPLRDWGLTEAPIPGTFEPVSGLQTPFGSVTRYCVECGQCLVLPTTDLGQSFRCPRCRSVYVAGALVDTSTPVAAVPASERLATQKLPAVSAELIERPSHGVSSIGVAQMLGSHTQTAPVAPRAIHPGTPPLTFEDAESADVRIPARQKAPARIVQGAAVALQTASKLVVLADQIDSHLYGKRARVLAIAAAVVVLPPTLARWMETPTWVQPVALAAFVLLAFTLSVARIAMFRNEEGRWEPALGAINLRLALGDAWDELKQIRAAHPNQRAQRVGALFIGCALVSLAVRAVADSLYNTGLDSWALNWDEGFDWIFFIVGSGLWASGTWSNYRDGQRSALLPDPAKNENAVRDVAHAFGGLPALIDCRDPDSAEQFTRHASHPLVTRLLGELGSWRPRRADTEKPYQHSLHRKLRAAVPEASPQLEVPLRSQGLPYTGRIDILLGRCVLVEIKRRLTISTAQKALGQIEMYVQLWNSKGPVVLVLCDTDPALAASYFAPAIERLRAAGHSVVAVLAAP